MLGRGAVPGGLPCAHFTDADTLLLQSLPPAAFASMRRTGDLAGG